MSADALSYCPQENALDQFLTVKESLRIVLGLRGLQFSSRLVNIPLYILQISINYFKIL